MGRIEYDPVFKHPYNVGGMINNSLKNYLKIENFLLLWIVFFIFVLIVSFLYDPITGLFVSDADMQYLNNYLDSASSANRPR